VFNVYGISLICQPLNPKREMAGDIAVIHNLHLCLLVGFAAIKAMGKRSESKKNSIQRLMPKQYDYSKKVCIINFVLGYDLVIILENYFKISIYSQ
jgi:hypothetical protein